MKNREWIERQTKSPKARRLYEQERLVTWVTDALYGAMEEAGLTKADLARALGTSRSHITQLFSGSRNMTLRTAADIAWACDSRATLDLEPLRDGQFVSEPVQIVQNARSRIVQQREHGATGDAAALGPYAA